MTRNIHLSSTVIVSLLNGGICKMEKKTYKVGLLYTECPPLINIYTLFKMIFTIDQKSANLAVYQITSNSLRFASSREQLMLE